MLALTHHCLVQFAAYRSKVIKVGQFFDAYALLGDDLVIANESVAHEYLKVMREIDVGINLSKSLVSVTGRVMEFAKRTIYNNTDVSAIPIKEIYAGIKATSAALEIVQKYSLTPAHYLRLFGAGYKVLGSINKPFKMQGAKWANLLVAYVSPNGPLKTS